MYIHFYTMKWNVTSDNDKPELLLLPYCAFYKGIQECKSSQHCSVVALELRNIALECNDPPWSVDQNPRQLGFSVCILYLKILTKNNNKSGDYKSAAMFFNHS